MKILDKRLELKQIMSELTQLQKKKVTCSLSLEAPCSKSSNEYITQNNYKHQESQKEHCRGGGARATERKVSRYK